MERDKHMTLKLTEYIMIFVIGGFAYNVVELIFRGYTFPSMFLVGGLCFLTIGLLNEKFPWEMPLISQMFISMCIVTFAELVFGTLLNIVLNLHIWDYSMLPYNLLGQISLIFSVAWFFLSLPAIIADDFIRHVFFGEEYPHYSLFYVKAPKGICTTDDHHPNGRDRPLN